VFTFWSDYQVLVYANSLEFLSSLICRSPYEHLRRLDNIFFLNSTGDEKYPIWSFLLPIQLSKSGHPPFFVRCRIPNWVRTLIGVSTLILHPKWVQMHNLCADERFVRFSRQIGPALS
jgi:hypothetical protein